MPPRPKIGLLVLCCAGLLTACASPKPASQIVTEIRVEYQPIPLDLLTCTEQPEPPADGATEKDAAIFIMDIAEAGQDCRDKLGAIRKLVR